MTITLFRNKSKTITVGHIPDDETVDHVPAAAYVFRVMKSMEGIRYDLEYRGDKLPVPDERYGEHEDMVKAILDAIWVCEKPKKNDSGQLKPRGECPPCEKHQSAAAKIAAKPQLL